MSVGFLVAEGALALGLTVLDGWVFEPGHVFVTSQNLASQWPLVAAISIGVSAGPVVAGGVRRARRTRPVGRRRAQRVRRVRPQARRLARRHVSLFYAACGAVFGWLAMLLRRTELEIADRRARDEVARVLHDTVLQTLALVERRVATTDPELAGAARDADRELRAFLFGADRRPGGPTLRSRLHAGRRARRAAGSGDGVADHGQRHRGRLPRSADREQDLLARAVGEAVANALEHAARRARRRVRRDRRRRPGVRHRARRRARVRSGRCISDGHGLSRVDHRPHGLDAAAGPRCAARPDGGPRSGCGSAAP